MSKEKYYGIDFLKLFFMFFIILHHSRQAFDILIRGYIGVEFFFIVSGFLLMRTRVCHSDLSTWEYIKRRIIKLYPHYFLSFIVMYVSTTIFRTGTLTIKQIINSLPEMFMIQNIGLFPGGLNYPCWYISVLVFASVTIFGLSRMCSKRIFNVVGVICCVIVYCYIAIHYGKIETFDTVGCFYLPFWRGVAGMFLGCVIYSITELCKKKRFAHVLHNVIEIITLSVVIILMYVGKSMDFVEIVLIVLLVIQSVNPAAIMNKLGNNRIVKMLSKYEYAIFLNHAFIICAYNKVIVDRIALPEWLHVTSILIILVVYSVTTQKLVDYCRYHMLSKVKR